jgi:transcription elongation factor Elf1
MNSQSPNANESTPWESAHVCPQCEHAISLGDIDMKGATTGVVTCPSCEWPGRIEIKIIDRER